jgi:hypothetical protein
MNREQVATVIKRLKIPVVLSDGNGIQIRRADSVWNNAPHGPNRWQLCETGIGAVWLEQVWRVRSGSGIAGNGDRWWLAKVGVDDSGTDTANPCCGPYRTMTALTDALRKWRKWELP